MTLLLRGFHVAVLLVVCWLFCNISLAWAQETPCQSNEVLVGISVSFQPLKGVSFVSVSIVGPEFRQEAGSNSNTSNFETFRFYESLLDNLTVAAVPVDENSTSVCVPGDQCLTLMVYVDVVFVVDDAGKGYQLFADEISIVYDGQDVSNNLQGPYPYSLEGAMYAVELGDCDVVCNTGEALLKIDASTGSASDYDWHVFDDMTGETIAHCPASSSSLIAKCYWTRDRFYSDRLCLANDGCYTLVVGRKYMDEYISADNVVTVVFDGNPILSLESLRYVSVKLNDDEDGGVCETSGCGSEARPLEMFVFRQYWQTLDENYTWTVSPVDEEDQTDGIIDSDVVSFDRAFYYRQACIPNTITCVQFQLSSMETSSVTDGIDSTWNITYRLVLDGITYTSRDFGTSYDPAVDFTTNLQLESLLYAGSTCSASQICSVEFMPVQIDMVTGRTWKVGDFDFRISYYSANGNNELFHSYKSILPEESYRFFPCVQASLLLQDEADSCTAFFADGGRFLDGHAAYNVSVNGVVFSEQYVPKLSPFHAKTIITPLAGSCDMFSSAQGTLPGILFMISSVLLVWCAL